MNSCKIAPSSISVQCVCVYFGKSRAEFYPILHLYPLRTAAIYQSSCVYYERRFIIPGSRGKHWLALDCKKPRVVLHSRFSWLGNNRRGSTKVNKFLALVRQRYFVRRPVKVYPSAHFCIRSTTSIRVFARQVGAKKSTRVHRRLSDKTNATESRSKLCRFRSLPGSGQPRWILSLMFLFVGNAALILKNRAWELLMRVKSRWSRAERHK